MRSVDTGNVKPQCQAVDVVNDVPEAYICSSCKALSEIWRGLNSLPRNLSVKGLPNSSPSEDTCAGKSSADDQQVFVEEKLERSCLLENKNLSPLNLALQEEEIPCYSRKNSNNNQK